MFRFGLAIFSVAIGWSAVQADNWPAWRGPNGDGHSAEKNLPTQWSKTDNVRWSIALPDAGNSTPIVWGNRVFVTQASEKKDWPPPGAGGPASAYRRSLICFDRATGRQLWQRDTIYKEKESTHPTNPFCSSSPVTDGERVVAWFGSAGMVCYDLEGNEKWRKDLGKFEQIWGNASSPIIYKDLVILWCGPGERQFLIALKKDTGEKVWEHTEPGGSAGTKGTTWVGSWCTPIVIKVADHDELIVGVPEKVKAFDPTSGKELWFCSGLSKLVYASPVYADGVVVVMSGYHGPALAVRTGGQGDVTQTHRLWHHAQQIPQRIGSPVIVEGRVYLLNEIGVMQCFDLKTGKDLWDKPRLEGKSWSSIVATDGNLYVLSMEGSTFVLKSGPTFERIAKNTLGAHTLSSLAISDGDLFIRDDKHLWCISNKK